MISLGRFRVSLLILVVVLMTVFSGCTFFPKEEEALAPPIKEPDKITYETVEVKKGDIENEIRVSGTFVSVSQRDLYYKDRGGRLEKIHVSLGDVVKSGDLIAELETDSIENDILLQEIDLKRAQISYNNANIRYDIEGGSKTEMELAQLDVDANRIKLNSLKNELESTKLHASIDGKVVYLTDTKLGEYVDAYHTIVRIADPTKLQLLYSGDKASSFELGMDVSVDFDGEHYTGKVVMTPNSIAEDADESLKEAVQIAVDNLPPDISIGKMVTIRLILESQSNVIIIPKRVVNSFVGRKFVNVLKDNIREERDIEVGIENNMEVEVIKGLEPGELIIVR